jgi:glycerol-3-phosphate dehydrogenase
MVGLGLFGYDHIAGRTDLSRATWHSAEELLHRDPWLAPDGLLGGYGFSDGQMDDLALGVWVADQAKALGVEIHEGREVTAIRPDGAVIIDGVVHSYDRVINAAGPWATQLLEKSGLPSPYQLDLVRGSHLVLADPTEHAYLVEVPGERRIAFILPWKGRTLVGTTEVRQTIEDPIRCDVSEVAYLSAVYRHYFPNAPLSVAETFAGVRPLLRSSEDPSRATREYALHRDGRLITIFGGKWTTAMALAAKVSCL